MPKALSLDLRSRVAAAVVRGEPVRLVAARFEVSAASAVRLGQKLRAGADLTAAKRGGPRPSPITATIADWLRARLAEKPDLTMRALAGELRERGTTVTHDTVWRFVRRQGLTVQKRRCSPPSRIAPPWPAFAGAGAHSRTGLIRTAWCLWTKPGCAPT